MRKKVLFIVIILFILISIYFYDSRIPELRLTYQKQTVKVQKFPFSWRSLGNAYQKDYPLPYELAKDMTALEVSPEGSIIFSFSKKPQYIEVSVWGNNSQINSNYESTKQGIIAPKNNGIYIFAVIGHYNKGQILYVFKLNVS